MGLIEPFEALIINTPFLFVFFEWIRGIYNIIILFHLLLLIVLLIIYFPKMRPGKREVIIIASIILLGVILRLIFAHPDINGEGYTHMAQGACLSLDEKRFDPFCGFRNHGGDHPLGWPIVLGMFWSVFPSSTFSGSLLTLLLSFLSLVMMWVVSRKLLKSRRAGIIATSLFAIFPLYVYFSAHTGTEVMNEVALLAAFFAYAVIREKRTVGTYLLFFIALAYAVQVRVDNWAVFFIFTSFVLIADHRRWKRMAAPLALSVALLLPAFYTTITYQKHHIAPSALQLNTITYLDVFFQLLLPLSFLLVLSSIGFFFRDRKEGREVIPLLMACYLGVQVIFILATHAKPYTYMYVHTISAVIMVIALGLDGIVEKLKRSIGEDLAISIVIITILASFFYPFSHYSSPYINAPNHFGMEERYPGFPRFSSVIFDQTFDPHLGNIDPTGESILIFIDHAVSAERVIINTNNPFIDFRMIESWPDIVKMRLFMKNLPVMESMDRPMILIIKKEPEELLYSLFDDHFALESLGRRGHFSVYSIVAE